MRIALIGEGTRGDVAPLCQLATLLSRRGHAVRLVSRPDFAPATPPGVEFRGVGTPIRDFTMPRAGAFQSMGFAFARASAAYLEEVLRVQFGELPDALEGCDLAFGAGMVLGAPSVAEKLALPYRLVLYCPALLPSPENAPAFFPFTTTFVGVNRVLWKLVEGPFDGWIRRALNRERCRLGLPALRRSFPHLLSERPVLCADAALGPLPTAWAGRADALPYLVPESPPDAPTPTIPEKLDAFLSAGEPPVFFGFGSMPDPHPAETTRLVLAAIEALGCRALLSAGWAGLGDDALPAQVAAVGEVSHASLFPRVAAVVHHGGAGTTTAAARAGVPQLVIPHVLDQYYWGQRVHQLGIGPPPLRRAQLSAGALADRVRILLEAEILSDAAARLGAELRAALGPIEGDLAGLGPPQRPL